MSLSWTVPAQQTGNLLDSTLSDYLAFDPLDHLDPVGLGLDMTPEANTMPNDATFDFDWSCAMDPNFCVLPNPDYFAIETPAGNECVSRESTAKQQDLGEAILRLDHRIDALERAVEARLVQIEDNAEAISQRLTEVERVKQAQDTEYALPFTAFLKVSLTIQRIEQSKEKIRAELRELFNELHEYRNSANLAAERLIGLIK